MALTRTKNKGKKYDEKECWDLYMSWGAGATVDKLHKWHLANTDFGSRMGGVWAMWRWAARNPELCYPQYRQWFFENNVGKTEQVEENGKRVQKEINPNITFNDFLGIIQEEARNVSVLSRRAYRQFCAKYELSNVENEVEVDEGDLARILIDRYGSIVKVDDMPDELVPQYALMVIESLQKEKNAAWRNE